MSTESSELTFVRCPQCRNLIPAVSTRCRRCGAGLASSASASEDVASSKISSQVSAKESAAPSSAKVLSSNASAASAVGGAAEPKVLKYPATSSAESIAAKPIVNSSNKGLNVKQAESFVDEDDPLGDYLNNLEEPAVVASNNTPASSTVDPFADDFDPFADPVQSNQALEQEDSFDPFADDSEGLKSEPIKDLDPFALASFDDDNDDNEEDEDDFNDEDFSDIFTEEAAPVNKLAEKIVKSVEAPPVIPTMPKMKLKAPVEDSAVANVAAKAHTLPSPKKSTSSTVLAVSSGKLIGWLVSFAEQSGAAVELRSGKFFITRKLLKEGDLVIDLDGISTPHAMVNIMSGGIQIQDLMSEKGLFIKRKGTLQFKREEDVASLRHGDWVKFGQVEYLISLLPEID